MSRTSVLEYYRLADGKVRELARFDGRAEAPFYLSDHTLCFNADGKIFRFDVLTGWTEQVPTGSLTRCNNDHVASYDKTRIAVSDNSAPDGKSRISIVDLSGKEEPRLVTPLGPSWLHGWSPDGQTLVYCAERSGEFDIYAISALGGAEKRLTDAPGLDDGPEFSPDGRTIYFNSVRSGLMECWRMDADGRHPAKLTGSGRNNWFPHISPDGKAIVYLSYDAGEVPPGRHPADKNVELRLIFPDGTGDRTLVSLFGGQGTMNVNSWSPDSAGFAFFRYEPD